MSYVGKKPKFLQSRISELAIPSVDITTAGAIANLSVVGNSNIRLTAATTVLGIVAPIINMASGKILYLTNANTTELVIPDQDVGATAENRIITGTETEIILSVGSMIGLQYDATASRWRVLGGTGSGSGTGSGTFRNYLSAWFQAGKPFTIANGGVTATGNRSALATSWASTNTSNWTMARTNSGTLRETYSYQLSGPTGAVNGSVFVESPLFTLDYADTLFNGISGGPLNLYTSLDVDTRSTDLDFVLVRYNSTNVYQGTIAISGMNSLSAATVPSQTTFAPTGTPFARYFGIAQTFSAVSATDKYALRIRSLAVAASVIPLIDSIYVGPNADLGVTDQRFVGNKQFADGLQAREGVNIPNTLDFPTTLTVASGESKIVGRLVVATGTTITVNGDLGCIGALTGPGLVNGSGVITSF